MWEDEEELWKINGHGDEWKRYREVCKDKGGVMGTCGELWALMVSYGGLWRVKGTYGELWALMGSYGHLWRVMGTYGELWALTECYWHLWRVMGTY